VREAAAPSLPTRIFKTLSSFGLSCTLLTILLYLTWKGTLAQVELGLKEAQSRYFDSLFARDEILGHTIYLPGAYLVLAALTVNLILGGLVRLRKSQRTAGILIAHCGIIIMVAAGFVKFHHSDDGYIDLGVGETTSEFVSFYDYELAITEVEEDAGQRKEWRIPQSTFRKLRPQDKARYTSNDLPFDLEISHFARNTRPVPIDDSAVRGERVVDGFELRTLSLAQDAEFNLAGCIATITPKDGSAAERAILFGYSDHPFTTLVGDREFMIDLRHERYPMPFAVRLLKFYKLTHPGVDLARDFSSDVVRIEDGAEHPVKIKMNEPLRRGDFILFQSKYRQVTAGTNPQYRSILSVVRNPSDQWPLYSCLVIMAGLVFQYSLVLYRYAKAQADRRAVA
jgi:ResB-like family